MVRPCFLILDPEHAASISSRKLVIETAKHNVITAYSSLELLETLDVFSGVSAVILNTNARDRACEDTARAIKERYPATPVITVGQPDGPPCEYVDHVVNNYDPQRLLDVLKTIQPEKSATILKHDEDLAREADAARE